jgi:plastocyanin
VERAVRLEKEIRMKRIYAILVTVVLALGLTTAGALSQARSAEKTKAPGAAAAKTLVGTTGPGFTITLKKNGVLVKKLKPGTYTITVHDKSSIHNFHLFGPGKVDKKTGVPFVGTVVWKVKLVAGKYTYRCDIHFSVGMINHFKVT